MSDYSGRLSVVTCLILLHFIPCHFYQVILTGFVTALSLVRNFLRVHLRFLVFVG